MKNVRLIFIAILFVLSLITIPFVYSKYKTTINKEITINVRKPIYTVTFHSNTNIDNTVSQSHTYGLSKRLTANSFNNSGYIFDGWNTEPDGSGTSYTDMQLVSNLTNIDNSVVDLYAQWKSDFSVTGNPINWTNQDVTLTVVLDSDNYSDYDYSFDGGVTWQDSNSMTFNSNQDVSIKIKDHGSYISDEKIVSITKIDKTLPTLSFDNSTEYNADGTTKSVSTLIATLDENKSITNGVNATDDLSGINGDVKCYRSNNEINSTNYFTYVGRYSINCSVSDKAGNEATEQREVLIRWPKGGKYVVRKTELDGNGIAGTGLSSTTSPDGLYKDNSSTGANSALPFASKYYYTGPNVENYLSFAGLNFRILNVSTNNAIKILGDVSDLKVRWGPSYEPKNRKIYESNTYNTWSTKWWPRGQIYNNETGESKYKLFTDTEKNHLALATFYAGRFNKSDATDIAYTIYYEQTGGVNLGGENDTNPAFEGYSAYPNVSDYLKASKAHDVVISINDTQDNGVLGIGLTKREVFNNNSWIDMSADQWTMNSKNATSTDNDYWVLDGTLKGRIVSRTFYYEQQYRVVFYITDTTILSGDGSSLNPYNVEENWTWFDSYQTLE